MDKPIIVNGSTLPTVAAVILRLALALLCTNLVSSGLVDEESTEGIIALGVGIVTVAYGIWKTWRTKKHLVAAAASADDRIAQVR